MAKRRAGFNDISVTDNGTMDPYDLSALVESIDELYRNVSSENIRKGSISANRLKIEHQTDIIISDGAETKIPHGLNAVPQVMIVVPKAENTWWQTRLPDSGFIYLKCATADIKHDIVLIA
jgi:hypothetical protein